MERPTRWIAAMGLAGALTLSGATLGAQEIQTFDDQVETEGDGGGNNVAVPGAPAPQQNQGQQQQQSNQGQQGDEEGEGEEGEQARGAYQVNIHGAQPGARGTEGGADTAEMVSEDHAELYQGVIPGKRDEVGHLEAIQEAGSGDATRLTWVGFRPEEDKTRVFFQSPSPVEYEIQDSSENNELVVVFDNAEISERNFSRFIDASHFDRAVDRIEADETDEGTVRVTLTMNEAVEPSTSTEGEYLYLDFPHQSESTDSAQADAE